MIMGTLSGRPLSQISSYSVPSLVFASGPPRAEEFAVGNVMQSCVFEKNHITYSEVLLPEVDQKQRKGLELKQLISIYSLSGSHRRLFECI